MIRRTLAASALLALCAVALSARPAAAQAGTCTITLPAICANAAVTGLTGFTFGPRTFCTFTEAINEAIRFERDLADVRSGGQLVFQSEFVRLCLEQDLVAIVDAARGTAEQRTAVLADIALLRSELTARRTGGLINNCFFRLTCGFDAAGLLVRCPEPPRECFTLYLDAVLACAAALVGDDTECPPTSK